MSLTEVAFEITTMHCAFFLNLSLIVKYITIMVWQFKMLLKTIWNQICSSNEQKCLLSTAKRLKQEQSSKLFIIKTELYKLIFA